ncbi:MAG: hypothetical protein ACRC0F_09365, partial [Cetobacterium sp.]
LDKVIYKASLKKDGGSCKEEKCPLYNPSQNCSVVLDELFGKHRQVCSPNLSYEFKEVGRSLIPSINHKGVEYNVELEEDYDLDNRSCDDCILLKCANEIKVPCSAVLTSLFGVDRMGCFGRNKYICTPINKKIITQLSDLDGMVSGEFELEHVPSRYVVKVSKNDNYIMEVGIEYCELLKEFGFRFEKKVKTDTIESLRERWKNIGGSYSSERNNLLHFDEKHGWMIVEVDKKDSFLTLAEAEDLLDRLQGV